MPRLREEVSRFAQIYEPARDDTGGAFYFSRSGIDNRDYDEDPVFSEHLPVAQNDFFDVAHAQAVYHDEICWSFLCRFLYGGFIHQGDFPVLDDQNTFRFYARRASDVGVQF